MLRLKTVDVEYQPDYSAKTTERFIQEEWVSRSLERWARQRGKHRSAGCTPRGESCASEHLRLSRCRAMVQQPGNNARLRYRRNGVIGGGHRSLPDRSWLLRRRGQPARPLYAGRVRYPHLPARLIGIGSTGVATARPMRPSIASLRSDFGAVIEPGNTCAAELEKD